VKNAKREDRRAESGLLPRYSLPSSLSPLPPMTKEQLQERAQLVRIHEANCQIEYPSPDEARFRLAIMKKLGFEFRLKELRPVTIAGPAPAVPPRTQRHD